MNSLTAKQLFYLLGAALLVSAAATTEVETAHKKEKCKYPCGETPIAALLKKTIPEYQG